MKKIISIAAVGAITMSMCVSAYALDASITVTPNDSGPLIVEDTGSASTGNGKLTLAGAVGDTYRANLKSGGELKIPITKPAGTSSIGLSVEFITGGDLIESVTVKNDSLVVKVKNPGNLTAAKEYTIYVTLYDMATGTPSKYYVTGIIEAGGSSSDSSKPDDSSSTPGGDDNDSSQSGEKGAIELEGAVNREVHANLFKYGDDGKAEIRVETTNKDDSVKIASKNIVKGEDLIRKVYLQGNRLMIEGKYPYDLLEPEDYAVDVTLATKDDKITFRISGTVYWQDSYGPVQPGEFREKKYVVVDFDSNEGDVVNFKYGYINTSNLTSGIANLDVNYSGDLSADCDGKDLYSVNFPARPRLDRNVTVCLDADEGNCVYEVNGSKLTKINASYNKTSRELRFETKRLTEYVVTEEKLGTSKKDDQREESSSSPRRPSSQDSSSDDSHRDTFLSDEREESGGTEDISHAKVVPNTGRYESKRA